MGKLYAIADLHVGYKFNADALAGLRGGGAHRDDGLILAGDLGERAEHLRLCFGWAASRFKTVWWCPGNHELYSMPDLSSPPAANARSSEGDKEREREGEGEGEEPLRGQAKYEACVALAREYGVLTPEDPFVTWEGEGEGEGSEGSAAAVVVCPVFTLYDYSFKPDDVPAGSELEWAAEKDICATDEALLHPDPYPSRRAWCDALVRKFEAKLAEAAGVGVGDGDANETGSEETADSGGIAQGTKTDDADVDGAGESQPQPQPQSKPKPKLIIVNHWPLLERLVYLPAIPRFRIWCGTKRTADWHTRFGAAVVVSGHLHIRRTDWVDGVRFEECSLGYPRQWERARNAGRDINAFLREIWPGPAEKGVEGVTKWWVYGDA